MRLVVLVLVDYREGPVVFVGVTKEERYVSSYHQPSVSASGDEDEIVDDAHMASDQQQWA